MAEPRASTTELHRGDRIRAKDSFRTCRGRPRNEGSVDLVVAIDYELLGDTTGRFGSIRSRTETPRSRRGHRGGAVGPLRSSDAFPAVGSGSVGRPVGSRKEHRCELDRSTTTDTNVSSGSGLARRAVDGRGCHPLRRHGRTLRRVRGLWTVLLRRRLVAGLMGRRCDRPSIEAHPACGTRRERDRRAGVARLPTVGLPIGPRGRARARRVRRRPFDDHRGGVVAGAAMLVPRARPTTLVRCLASQSGSASPGWSSCWRY